jgi:hypothetical protein
MLQHLKMRSAGRTAGAAGYSHGILQACRAARRFRRLRSNRAVAAPEQPSPRPSLPIIASDHLNIGHDDVRRASPSISGKDAATPDDRLRWGNAKRQLRRRPSPMCARPRSIDQPKAPIADFARSIASRTHRVRPSRNIRIIIAHLRFADRQCQPHLPLLHRAGFTQPRWFFEQPPWNKVSATAPSISAAQLFHDTICSTAPPPRPCCAGRSHRECRFAKGGPNFRR